MYTTNKTETFHSTYRRGYEPSRRHLIFCLLITALLCLTAASNTASAAIYYLDAVNGNDSNPGTINEPWQTFGRALTSLQPGDTALLKSGYYGDIVLSNTHNSDYITIAAQPGHTPGFRRIRLTNVGRWIFRGLTISPELAPTYNPSNPERYLLFEIKGSSNNVTLEDSELYYIDDSSGWSASDWAALFVPSGWSNGIGGICAVNVDSADQSIIRNNTVRNVYFGICMDGGADNTLVEYNTIENIAGDGMGVHTSNAVIQYNTLKNFYDVDGNHDDGIQSFTTTGERFDNVVVRGNYILSREPGLTNPLLTRDGPMGITGHSRGVSQGCPDGSCYSNWVIENNLIVAEHSLWGIHLADPRDSIIRNNIAVNPTGVQNQNLIIRIEDAFNTPIINNMASACITWSGTTVSHNLDVDDYDWDELFVDWQNLDFRHADGSPAIDAGTAENAPNIDIVGTTRPQGAAFDIGAYEFVSSGSQAPIANAGSDQTVTDSDNNGSEPVTLDGSGSSDPDGTIESYAWSEGGSQIATGDSPVVTLSVGAHTITLTVTDNNDLTDTDTVVITVEGPDETAPSIVSVSASETSVEITFNESLDTVSAEQTSNYSINNGISVTAASLDTDTVTLTTSAHTEGTYTLTVENVQDTSANPMAETTRNYEYDNGLVAHWKFDDGSGNSAVDSSGNGNTGTLINGPTWTTGKIDGALSFDGTNQYVETGAQDIVSPWTASLWVEREDSSNSNAALLDSSNYSLKLEQYPNLNNVGFSTYGVADYIFNYEAPIGSWAHLVFVGTQTQVVLYVDGALEDSIAASISCPMAQISSVSRAINGTIDEVRVYNRALTAGEILALYNAGTSDPVTHTLGVTAVNGSVTKTPDKASYNHSEEVTLQPEPNTGYSFVNWSGDLTGSSNPATIVMDADKLVTANFTITINTYTLNITADDGSVTKTPDQATYDNGTTVTLQATANTGYSFASWSGDASGTSNPTTVVMDGNKSVTANFTINTYTLGITATNGSVAKTPDQSSYDHGTTVTLQATANAGYTFASWSGDASGTSNPTTVVMDDNKSITANFTVGPDETAPTVTQQSPAVDSVQVSLNSLISLHVVDAGDGVDSDSVIITVNGDTVYTGNTADYISNYGSCHRTGTEADYRFAYQSDQVFDFDQTINVTVNAQDLAGNSMAGYSYSFKTEMHSFGENKKVSSDTLSKGRPVTVRDSSDNIWAAWHAGATGSRDIYIGKLAAGADNFGHSIIIRDNSADQCNPVIAVGSDDKLYVAWQDNRRGNWDIYISTSNDGTNWSAETRVTDSNDNQINPAIVVDSSNNAYIVWEDNRNGNQDIYVATSNNGFVTKTITQITSDSSDQVEPAIAADSDNTIYVVWTDTRNSKNDIYGAASNNGPWTNVAIVNNANNQSNPAIATESEGSILHLLWVDDTPGDNDIYYAKTNGGLPGSPLTGSSIIDDTTGADQSQPAIAVTGSSSNNLKVFAFWEDERNADDDLYFAELGSGSGTNVFVDDDGTNTDQTEPAIGIDGNGHPYLVWTDSRNTNTDIYYAGSTYIESTALASGNTSTSSTVTVGTPLNAIDSLDDVSVVVPAGAYPFDIEITISKISNPLAFAMQRLGAYDFGPSGIEFSQPVTVTIPYNATGSATVAYWYNSLTDALSQQGITDVETIVVSPTLHALRFKTTHFTPFYIFLASAAGAAVSGGGGGGGGCSMSPDSQANIVELLLPYIGLTAAMVVLKLRDRRKRKAHNITKN